MHYNYKSLILKEKKMLFFFDKVEYTNYIDN